MGKYSRDKGKRGEYQARDALRADGFLADRVPSSGAAQGFKGDIKFSRNGVTMLAEVKVRAGQSFKHVYQLFADTSQNGLTSVYHARDTQDLTCIDIADKMSTLLASDGYYNPLPGHKGIKQALKLQEMLKEADVLIIKNDRKPFLYLRYKK